jgi:hypothetical protein
MGNSVLARNVLLLGALDAIAAAAAEKDLTFIVLKGAALLAEGVWRPEEREMTDLDLLIRPGDEKAFDVLLTALEFKPMENSSQAYFKMAGVFAPPVIVDIHTGLWHEKETKALWHRSRFLTVPVPELSDRLGRLPHKGLGFEDQLLHLASHTLLYHGSLTSRTLADIARLLVRVYASMERRAFWLKTSEIAAGEHLTPVVYPVLKRFLEAEPVLMSAAELAAFRPRGTDRLKSLFFEKASAGYSRPLEYFLPGLYRPRLFCSYLFPGKTFLERRYGKASLAIRLTRPFRLVAAVFGKDA